MSDGRSISVGAQHAAPLPHRSARHLVDRSVDYVCGMKLVLFDIDGTLLWTDGAGRRAIQRALVDEAGTAGPIESYRFDGKTDPQIVRDLLSLAGHSGAENATVIQAVAAGRAAALAGATFAGSDVIIVGDTPDDVACGRPIGARSVAVATGSYDVAALRATGAAYVFETLADTAAVLDAIFT